MKCDLPIVEFGLGWLTSYVAKDILRRSLFSVLGIQHAPTLVEFQYIGKDSEGLLLSAGLAKNARVINSLEQGMTDRTIRNPIGEASNGTTHRMA